MLDKNKKTIFHKSFLPMVLMAIPLSAYALSFSEFLGYRKTAIANEMKLSTERLNNLQNLKVFEPNKVYAENPEKLALAKSIVKEEKLAFEVQNDFVDDFSESSHKVHSENAIYTVQKGDSIYSIASYFGVSVETIMTFNRKQVITVHVGDVLEVPDESGILYKVNKGDTLTGISKKYGLDEEDISLYNGLVSSDKLVVGSEIYLPGAKEKQVVVKSKIKSDNLAKNNLAKVHPGISTKFAKGATTHLNTRTGIHQYSTLPKYEGYFAFPAPGTVRSQKMHGHNAVDLAGKMGTPVLASASGVVTTAKTGGYNYGYGNYIKVTHANGSETIYAHLQRVDVSVGQSVSRGEHIALLGNSGNSTGPHLHFEIRGAFNPFAW